MTIRSLPSLAARHSLVRATLRAGVFLAALGGAASTQASQSSCDAVSGNLVQNCGFEFNLPVWSSSGQLVNMGPNGVGPHSGGGAWTFANRDNFGRPDIYPNQGPGYLSQELPTVPGAQYALSFWLVSTGVGDSAQFPAPFIYNRFSVDWGGNRVFDLQDFNPLLGSDNFLHYNLIVSATADSTSLRLGGSHNIAAYVLDDVVVTLLAPPTVGSVPEPAALGLVALALALSLAATSGRATRRTVASAAADVTARTEGDGATPLTPGRGA